VRKLPKWISKQAVFAIHERLLAEHGGAPGLLDEGMLDAALASPKNHFAYRRADILRLAAAYAHALTQSHPFADGNKRVALTVAGVFMELNGLRLEASEQDAANATRALSSREIDEVEFAGWLRTRSSRLRASRRRTAVTVTIKGRRKSKKK
jgi:death on curing protein